MEYNPEYERVCEMKSLWTDMVELPSFPSLKGEVKTDVLIIGGGMAGILCAYFLQEKGINYILAEGRTVASGITKNTTAKITSQHGLIYDKLKKHAGSEKAHMYLYANEQAIQTYQTLSKSISCELEEKDAYVYSMTNPQKIEAEMKALQELGFHAQFEQELQLPFPVKGAIKFEHQAQFHPLRFAKEVCRKLHIYENTFVHTIDRGVATTVA